jgi:hypothetical protein
MKERQEPSPFEDFDALKELRGVNRQNAYENKVCRKMISRLFPKGSEEHGYWMDRLGASSTPLADMQELFGPFHGHSHRMESWSINDLLAPQSKLLKIPIWQEFAKVIDLTHDIDPKAIPAMVFYNSVIGQDLVLHTGIEIRSPPGYFRLVRLATSKEGGAVMDTLDGFLKTLGAPDEV